MMRPMCGSSSTTSTCRTFWSIAGRSAATSGVRCTGRSAAPTSERTEPLAIGASSKARSRRGVASEKFGFTSKDERSDQGGKSSALLPKLVQQRARVGVRD